MVKPTRKSGQKESPAPSASHRKSLPPPTPAYDVREQLFNEGKTGQITEIQISAARITQVLATCFDIDPVLLRSPGLLGTVPTDPGEFYSATIAPMLASHPVLSRAEVRNSGSGLHVILRYAEPYQCDTDAAREKIAAVHDVVTRILPTDPHQPGLTALTRKIGSINSKNDLPVTLLNEGGPVGFKEVLALAQQTVDAPFKTIASVLFHSETVRPCPFCLKPGSSLVLLPHGGRCYACGTLKLDQLWGRLYVESKDAFGDEVACAG